MVLLVLELLRVLVFPPLRLFTRDPGTLQRRARALIRISFATHIGIMHRLGVMTYEIHGLERLQRRGLLVLANHPTLVDVVLLVSRLPHADCVVKSKLANNPFTRGPVRATGYICNDNGAGLVDDCIASVRAGYNLLVFPEGTRTPGGEVLGPLQRGAANIAVRGGFDVTPVVIRCEPRTLGKGEKWYRVPARRFHLSVAVLPDVRRFLQSAQQRIGQNTSLVCEGRDMGTKVFPRARHKFFLDAAPEARARRRFLQLKAQGRPADLKLILSQIKARDEQDRGRPVDPLRPAPDAVVVDTGALDISGVVAAIKADLL